MWESVSKNVPETENDGVEKCSCCVPGRARTSNEKQKEMRSERHDHVASSRRTPQSHKISFKVRGKALK